MQVLVAAISNFNELIIVFYREIRMDQWKRTGLAIKNLLTSAPIPASCIACIVCVLGKTFIHRVFENK